MLYGLLRTAGTPDVLRRHVPDAAALGSVQGGFITPGRADNFLLDVDQAWAADVLERAYVAIV